MIEERIAFDQETHLIGPGAVFPRPVVATFARRIPGRERPEAGLVASGDPEWIAVVDQMLDWLEAESGRSVVMHNGHGFDLPVQAIWNPRLMSRIYKILARGVPQRVEDVIESRFRDTLLREKLLNLAMHGVVDYYFTPDGQAKDIRYNLASLVAKHLGIDRSEAKGQDAEGNQVRQDIWRLNFASLDGLPRDKIPSEAASYAVEDAVDTLLVSEKQDALAGAYFTANGAVGHDGKPFDVFRTEGVHVAAMFCLSLATFEGFGIDAAAVQDLKDKVEQARRPEQVEILYSSALYSRPLPSRPYKNGAVHGEGGKPCSCGATSHDPGTPKMVAAEPSHRDNKRLLELVVKAWVANKACDEDGCPRRGQDCDQHGLPPLKKTEPSKTHPEGQISCDGEVVDDLAPFCDVLDTYSHYRATEKLVTNEIPRLEEALQHGGTIHPSFDDFKKTSRTSSRKSRLYPSINIQQIGRSFDVELVGADLKPLLDAKGKPKNIKIEPRHCYIPRQPGWVLVSIDYSFIELVTLAQTTKRVIGYSVLADKIAKGFDPHGFLGAQLAAGLEADFVEACRVLGHTNPDAIYEFFESLKAGTDDEKKFYKHWRTLAKSVGLGYPGGLGPRTFIVYAKKLYGVTVKSIEQAKAFREVWLQAFPENREYLQSYIRDNLRDEQHSDEERERFCYFSPLGSFRARCSFTEAANGKALQTPAAEGFKIALFNVQRACWDPELRSCLYGCRTVAAIHDEIIIAMPNDQWLHERAFEASRLWIQGMGVICPDVPVKADPAAMVRWDKGAEMVLGPDERLRVWDPKAKYAMDTKRRLRSAT